MRIQARAEARRIGPELVLPVFERERDPALRDRPDPHATDNRGHSGGAGGAPRPGRQAGAPVVPRRRAAAGVVLLRARAGSDGPGPARGVRHLRTPGLVAALLVQRGPHPRDEPGARRAPAAHGIDGPLFLGMDTHALSEPALSTALEVFAAAGVEVRIQTGRRYTPTPAVSHAILTWNRGRRSGLADGVVVTPSHNPPDDGGFKYNPPDGGPAGTEITKAVEARANAILETGTREVRRLSLSQGPRAPPPLASTTSWPRTSRTSRTSSTWRPSRGRGSASASTHSAAPRSSTGRRSPSATGCRSRS